jgi:hypothetical protein
MLMNTALCASVLNKVEDQIDRLDHLIGLVPDGQLEWVPPMTNGFSVTVLFGHLLECLAGFCAVLYAVKPEQLSHFLELKKQGVNHKCGKDEARSRLEVYQKHVREGFAILQDSDLGRRIPTVFVPDGESLLSLLLINFEHLSSHKHQLFIYLRLLGVKVESRDLYHFSGGQA